MRIANIAGKNTQPANVGYLFLLQKWQCSHPHEVTKKTCYILDSIAFPSQMP